MAVTLPQFHSLCCLPDPILILRTGSHLRLDCLEEIAILDAEFGQKYHLIEQSPPKDGHSLLEEQYFGLNRLPIRRSFIVNHAQDYLALQLIHT